MSRTDARVMRDLLAKVKAAKGPDRRLDYEIFAAFSVEGQPNIWDPNAGHFYTASSDEGVALAEQMLPAIEAFVAGSPTSSGWKLCFYRGMTPTSEPYGHWQASMRKHGRDGIEFSGRTPPLAIVGSLLSALIAQEATDA